MKRSARNKFFYTLLVVLAVAIGAGLWFTGVHQQRLREVKDQFRSNNQQLDAYLKRPIAPTRANLEVLENNYLALYRDFQRTSTLLNLNTYDRSRFFAGTPESKTEAFFEIASYVENARNLATDSEVDFPADFRFGFNKYSNTGPEEEGIERVHRQVKILDWLVKSLLDSRISELVRVQRELYVDPAQKTANRRETSDTDLNGDEFFMPTGSSLSVENVIHGEGFRLAFKGQSLSLRNFLNRIVDSALPIVVRGVEVELATNLDSGAKRSAIGDNPFFRDVDVDDELMEAARIPIISENESLFVVTVEFLEMKAEIEEPVLASEEGEEGTDAEV